MKHMQMAALFSHMKNSPSTYSNSDSASFYKRKNVFIYRTHKEKHKFTGKLAIFQMVKRSVQLSLMFLMSKLVQLQGLVILINLISSFIELYC